MISMRVTGSRPIFLENATLLIRERAARSGCALPRTVHLMPRRLIGTNAHVILKIHPGHEAALAAQRMTDPAHAQRMRPLQQMSGGMRGRRRSILHRLLGAHQGHRRLRVGHAANAPPAPATAPRRRAAPLRQGAQRPENLTAGGVLYPERPPLTTPCASITALPLTPARSLTSQ